MRSSYKTEFQNIKESSTLSLAKILLSKIRLSQGQVICDPFAGAGTFGLQAAVENISSINIESNKKVYLTMKSNFKQLKSKKPGIAQFTLIHVDSEKVKIDGMISAVITSPPFTLSDTANPPRTIAEYKIYIKKLERIFKRFIPILTREARIIVLIGNDKHNGKTVTISNWFTQALKHIGYHLISSEIRPEDKNQTKILTFEIH